MKLIEYEKDTRVGNNKPIEAKILHERAREASIESRKLIISLLTGLLAFTFFVIIGENLKNISKGLKIILAFNMFFISVSLIAGIIAWIADARRNYFKAKEIQVHKNNIKSKKRYNKMFKMWETRRKRLDTTLRYGFAISIIIYALVIVLILLK